jgi:hypothetical protein
MVATGGNQINFTFLNRTLLLHDRVHPSVEYPIVSLQIIPTLESLLPNSSANSNKQIFFQNSFYYLENMDVRRAMISEGLIDTVCSL